jgi:23S rRNA (cytosine1962-C5)-methyltransferase
MLEQLPDVGERRIAVRVTPDALRQVRGGSPWVYDGSIVSVSHDGAPGDLAVIFDDRRKFAAIGLWDPDSPIRIKVLHRGDPTAIDGAWWRNRLADAFDRRAALTADAMMTGYRCVHGENDGLPGLVVDRYDTSLVVKL